MRINFSPVKVYNNNFGSTYKNDYKKEHCKKRLNDINDRINDLYSMAELGRLSDDAFYIKKANLEAQKDFYLRSLVDYGDEEALEELDLLENSTY